MPWDAIGNLILGAWKAKKVQQWCSLIFSLVFSGIVSFCFVAGSVMLSTKSFTLGVGSGLVAVAVVMAAILRRHPLTKGMLFILPAEEAAEEIKTDLQVIQR